MTPISNTTAALHGGAAPAASAGPLLRVWEGGVTVLVWLQSPALLAARIYVGLAFFRSGLTKLNDWGTTLALFQDEYHVPFLPTSVAAVMGTAGELVLPVLLVLGLAGRFGALGLSVVNAIAVLSLAEIAPAALGQHHLWGVLLAVIALWGPGKWSIDHLLWPRLRARITGRAA